jgi:uncharacterized delta-60 repeat protein
MKLIKTAWSLIAGIKIPKRGGQAHRKFYWPLIAVLATALVAAQASVALAGPARAQAGTLDKTFGTGGKVMTDFTGGFDQANALVVQDGKLVAAGMANGDFGLVRYKPNGALDRTFGTGGKVTTDFFGNSDVANALIVQPDGKLVAAGAAFLSGGSNPDFALARYNRNGSLDKTFGNGGKVTTDFSASHDVAHALVRQPDGKLVAAGLTENAAGTQLNFALARYNRNGSIDKTFGNGGKVITDFGGGDEANALVVQANGKLVAAGYTDVRGTFDFALARYNRNGTLDASFGSGGKVLTDFAGNVDRASALVLQRDGKLVAAGETRTASASGFALARYNRDGSLDARFGTRGEVTTIGLDQAKALVLQPDGKLVAAGSGFGAGFDFALARYNRNGSLDKTFGNGGTVTTDFASSFDQASALVLQANGKLVAAGIAYTESDSAFALARYRTR